MKNVHTRDLAAPVELVRPWIERCWSGGELDAFPHDYIRTWRRNPAGTAPDELVPGVTQLGHGPFRFLFEGWDGERWRVRVDRGGFRGWHGFDLTSTATGSHLTHTIELKLTGSARLVWPLAIARVHDWAVEAMFDRIQEALQTGHVPAVTARRPPRLHAWLLRLQRRPARPAGGAGPRRGLDLEP